MDAFGVIPKDTGVLNDFGQDLSPIGLTPDFQNNVVPQSGGINQVINVNAGVSPEQVLKMAQTVGEQTRDAIRREIGFSGTSIRRQIRSVPS